METVIITKLPATSVSHPSGDHKRIREMFLVHRKLTFSGAGAGGRASHDGMMLSRDGIA